MEIFGVVLIVVLSYVHIDGDFNPRRVMVARVHEGLHPQRVHEEANLVYPTMAIAHEGLASLGWIFTK